VINLFLKHKILFRVVQSNSGSFELVYNFNASPIHTRLTDDAISNHLIGPY